MITHYDMTTGEVIEDENHDRPAQAMQHPAEREVLRLMTVHEAVTVQGPDTRLPTDIATLPVDLTFKLHEGGRTS